MALKLPISRDQNAYHADFRNGYHKISEININRENRTVRINIFSYPDEDARRFVQPKEQLDQEPHPGHHPAEHDRTSPHISAESFSISLEKYDATVGNELEKAYGMLKKEVPKFLKAEDC